MFAYVECEGTVIEPNASGVDVTVDLLELQRMVAGIAFEQIKVFVCQRLHLASEMSVMEPEIRMSLVLHRSEQ